MVKFFNAVLNYFDLHSNIRGLARAQGEDVQLRVFPQYLAMVLGIFIQPYLEHFRTTHEWQADVGTVLGWGLFAFIAGLIIFPSVYRKSFDPGQPLFVQFCVIFVAGNGWQALFNTAVKALK